MKMNKIGGPFTTHTSSSSLSSTSQIAVDAVVVLLIAIAIIVSAADLLSGSFSETHSLSFELPVDKRMCFYHEIEADGKYSFGFKALTSGRNFTVNAEIESPSGRKLYSTTGLKSDATEFDVLLPGTFMFCFKMNLETAPTSPPPTAANGSESGISDLIAIDTTRDFVHFGVRLLQPGPMWLMREENRLQLEANATAIVQIEDTLMKETFERIDASAQQIIQYQTLYRRNEEVGSDAAIELNHHVTIWSIAQSIVLLVTGFGQVILLKFFFTERRSMTVIAMDVGQHVTPPSALISGLPIRP